MYDFWQDNYEWLLSGIIPTLITAIFGIIKYRKNKRNKDVSQEKNIQTNTIYANNNSGHITNNNHQNINIGDTKNTAERRYKNAIEIVKNELLDNYRDLCVLINGIEVMCRNRRHQHRYTFMCSIGFGQDVAESC